MCLREDSRVGSVGPSLEYGGVAVAIVVSIACSVGDANMSLMRLALAMPCDECELNWPDVLTILEIDG